MIMTLGNKSENSKYAMHLLVALLALQLKLGHEKLHMQRIKDVKTISLLIRFCILCRLWAIYTAGYNNPSPTIFFTITNFHDVTFCLQNYKIVTKLEPSVRPLQITTISLKKTEFRFLKGKVEFSCQKFTKPILTQIV